MLPDILARPYSALELKTLYEETDIAATYDLTTDIADAKTAIHILVNNRGGIITSNKATVDTDIDSLITAFKALWPFADVTAFNAAAETLRIDLHTTVNDNIDDDVSTLNTEIDDAIDTNIPSGSGTATYWEVLDQINADFVSLIIADGRIYTCPECGGIGEYTPVGGELMKSPLCDGYGNTTVAYQAVVSGFEIVP